MFKNSVITQSGQLWKLILGVVALIVGSVAPLFPETGISMTVGTVVAVLGYAFSMLLIRCKDCNNLWLWEAAKDAGLYGPIFKTPVCPACKHSYAPADKN